MFCFQVIQLYLLFDCFKCEHWKHNIKIIKKEKFCI